MPSLARLRNVHRVSPFAAAALSLLTNANAVAARPVDEGLPTPTGMFTTVERSDGVVLARQALAADDPVGPAPATGALAQSRVVYLNRIGATLTPGNNNATTNRSTIATRAVALAPWNASPTLWADTVSCMRELFAPFDVSIVTDDPGATPHIEAIFTASTMAVLDPSVPNANQIGGVSPFTANCGIIENSIVFTFTSVLPQNARTMCEVMAQEVAHSYGLDHQLLASDPMTYLNYNGNRSFKDQTVACGEYSQRACGIGGSVCRANQNSVQLLRERLGVADTQAPRITNIVPADNTTVQAGFAITVEGADDQGIAKVELRIDGQLHATKTQAPYTFTAPATLPAGPHTLEAAVYDGKQATKRTVSVTVSATGAGNTGNGAGNDGNQAGNGNAGTPASDTDDTQDNTDYIGGCTAAPQHGGLAWSLLALAGYLGGRRRGRTRGARGR